LAQGLRVEISGAMVWGGIEGSFRLFRASDNMHSTNVVMTMNRDNGGRGDACLSNLFICREGISWEAKVADDDVRVIILHPSLVNKVLTEHGKGIRHAC
jgi:hypothetical protein